MIFIDTNIFLRAILSDHTEFSSASKKIFTSIKDGEIEGITSDLVVAEIVFMLQKQASASFTRETISNLVLPFLSLPNLESPSKSLWEKIFTVYVEKNVDFIDAYNMVIMKHKGVAEAYSYDHDFDKVKLLKRIEP